MDWNHWIPQQRATLCFIVDGSRVLLIRKLRGLGAGKMNAPGGKIEPGETALACAVRETQEELGVTPLHPALVAELSFHFTDGFRLHCTVFLAHAHQGEAQATDEAIPFWTPLSEIPYAEMWQDDALWLPRILQGEKLRGCFIFADDKMLSHDLQTLPTG